MYNPTDSLRREPRKEGEVETAIISIIAKNGKKAQIQFVSFNSELYKGQCVMIYKIKGTTRTYYKCGNLDMTSIKIISVITINDSKVFVSFLKQGNYGNQSIYYGEVNIYNPGVTNFKNVFMNGYGEITSISIGEDGLIYVTNTEHEWYIEPTTGEVRQFKLAPHPTIPSSSSSLSVYGKNIPLTAPPLPPTTDDYGTLPPLPSNNTGNPYSPMHGHQPPLQQQPEQPAPYEAMPPRENFIPEKFRRDEQ